MPYKWKENSARKGLVFFNELRLLDEVSPGDVARHLSGMVGNFWGMHRPPEAANRGREYVHLYPFGFDLSYRSYLALSLALQFIREAKSDEKAYTQLLVEIITNQVLSTRGQEWHACKLQDVAKGLMRRA